MIILAGYLGIPFAMGVISVLPARSPVGSLPDGFEAVDLRAKDGVGLQAWYHPPENGAVILLLHGAGGSREGMRAQAQMFTRHGYGVLALDLRGHGGSEGKTNRLGWNGTLDVGAAVAFLQTRREVKKIGGLGSSMGGEVLLGAVSSYPLIQAAAADGATRRCTDELLALEEERPLVHNFTPRVMYAAVQLLSGERPPLASVVTIHAGGGWRALLFDRCRKQCIRNLIQSTVQANPGEPGRVMDCGRCAAYGRVCAVSPRV